MIDYPIDLADTQRMVNENDPSFTSGMKIGLMICGGTFDSQESDEGREVSEFFFPALYEPLLSAMRKSVPGVNLQLLRPPFRIDSSQLAPRNIHELVFSIRKFFASGGDCILVAFGTDSHSYVAPAVATALGRISDKSVAFVSGMNPWHSESSDALRNIIDATLLLSKRHHRGVMVISGGRVYPAFNLVKVSHDAIDPFREVLLHQRSQFKTLPEVLQERLGRGVSVGKPYADSEIVTYDPPVRCELLMESHSLEPVVGQILVFPGLTTDGVLRFVGDEYKHMIFRCYANGTVPVSPAGLEFDIGEAVRKLQQRDVMCYGVSQHLGAVAPSDYNVCKEMENAGCLYVTRFTPDTLHGILLVLAAVVGDPYEVRERIREAEGAHGPVLQEETKFFPVPSLQV